MGDNGSPVFFVYPEHLSRACGGMVEGLALSHAVSLSKEFTLSIVEGPSTISNLLVPGRALSPPSAFWFCTPS